eukprot:Gb_26629 [translate_table: standard]
MVKEKKQRKQRPGSVNELRKKVQQEAGSSVWFEEAKITGGEQPKGVEWKDPENTRSRRNVFVLAAEIREETKDSMGGVGQILDRKCEQLRGSIEGQQKKLMDLENKLEDIQENLHQLRKYAGAAALTLIGQL